MCGAHVTLHAHVVCASRLLQSIAYAWSVGVGVTLISFIVFRLISAAGQTELNIGRGHDAISPQGETQQGGLQQGCGGRRRPECPPGAAESEGHQGLVGDPKAMHTSCFAASSLVHYQPCDMRPTSAVPPPACTLFLLGLPFRSCMLVSWAHGCGHAY